MKDFSGVEAALALVPEGYAIIIDCNPDSNFLGHSAHCCTPEQRANWTEPKWSHADRLADAITLAVKAVTP